MVVCFHRSGRFRFLRFENAASCITKMLENMRTLANSCLLACVVALWSARTLFAALCGADCAVLCSPYCRCSTTTARACIKKGPQKQNKKKEKEGSSNFFQKKTERNRKKPRPQVIEEGVVQAGALRGQRGANGARREEKTDIRNFIVAEHQPPTSPKFAIDEAFTWYQALFTGGHSNRNPPWTQKAYTWEYYTPYLVLVTYNQY